MPNNEFFQTDAFAAKSVPETELEDKTYVAPIFNNTYEINGYVFQENTVKPVHGINDTPYPEPDVINFQQVKNDFIT